MFKGIKEIAIAAVILAGVFFVGRYTAPIPEPEVRIETRIDTTTVDSLLAEVEFWREIAEEDQDTIRVEIPVPVPTDVEPDGTRTYQLNHEDANLKAQVGLTIEGLLKDSNFTYTIKREKVVVRTNLRTVTITENTTQTITTNYEAPPKFITGAIEVGYKFDNEFNNSVYVEPQAIITPLKRLPDLSFVGKAHISNQPYLGAGIKFTF